MGLSRYGAREQGFACTGMAHEKYAPWNAGAQLVIFGGILEEIDLFLQIRFHFVHSCNVRKGYLWMIACVSARLGTGKTENAALCARSLPAEPYEQHYKK